MLNTAQYGSNEHGEGIESQKKIDDFIEKLNDIYTLSSRSDGEISVRDAHKVVFGEDIPELDTDSPIGMRAMNKMRSDGWFTNE